MDSVKELLEEHGQSEDEVYLDWENGSVVDIQVFEEMRPYFLSRGYGNPSITHRYGWEAYEEYMKAKRKIALPLNIDPQSLHLTHGITESNNLAIRGVALENKKEEKNKILVSKVEHLSVIHSARRLYDDYDVETIPVCSDGTIDVDQLNAMLDDTVVLVSCQTVNHEIGTIQPIKEIVDTVKSYDENIIVHTDASSGFGRVKMDLSALNVDLATIPSDKILGPKGIAGLYVKDGVKVKLLIEGQLSVETLSPGIENLPLLMGFAKAVELQFEDFEKINEYTRKLKDKLLYGLKTSIAKVLVNGPLGNKRVVDNANLSFLNCEGEALTVESSMKGIYASSGSACTSRVLMPSHILTSIGRKPEEAHGSLLMKVNRLNTEEQIEYVLETLPKVVERIRGITGGIQL